MMPREARSGGREIRLAVCALLLAGCSFGPQEDPTRFYVLSDATEATGGESWDAAPRQVDLGVGPFTIPGYLDRPQVVRRVGPNEVQALEAARWAESLADGFERVLAENLAAELPGARVHPHPWRSRTTNQWIISGDVHQFEAGANGEAVLDVSWKVYDPDGDPTEVGARSVVRLPGAGGSVEADIEAMSQVLERFASQLAAELRRLGPPLLENR